ncbi:hypothetical protein ABK040_001614 [Willaertia magna]
MDINEFKRKYSNESDTKAVCDWLFENVGNEKWSFWLADYKFNGELSGPVWMQSNLIGGFFRNIEEYQKNCFASALVMTNDEGAQKIGMVWLVPGQELPPKFHTVEVGACMAESFDLVKINPLENEKDRDLVTKYFCWTEDKGAFDGYTYASGKIFK